MPMRTTSPQDRKAIEAWVSEHDAGADLVASLSSLDDGEGWVWSPHWLHILKKVRFRRRRTFDSGATPTFGGVRPAARAAEVDLAALKDRMAATIERAETNDLIGRLEELARDLTSAMPNDADGKTRSRLTSGMTLGRANPGTVTSRMRRNQVTSRCYVKPPGAGIKGHLIGRFRIPSGLRRGFVIPWFRSGQVVEAERGAHTFEEGLPGGGTEADG